MQHLPEIRTETYGFDTRRRTAPNGVAMAGLLASGALAVGTIIAVTVVTMGIARAGGLTTVVENESGVFIIALLLGALFVASCITKAVAPRRNERRNAIRSGFGNEHFPSR